MACNKRTQPDTHKPLLTQCELLDGGTISSPDILLSNVEFSWSLITSHLSGHSKGGEATYLFTRSSMPMQKDKHRRSGPSARGCSSGMSCLRRFGHVGCPNGTWTRLGLGLLFSFTLLVLPDNNPGQIYLAWDNTLNTSKHLTTNHSRFTASLSISAYYQCRVRWH